MIFWDVQVRNKIRTFQFNCNPVICSKMSPDGSMLAYALGNDFSKGPEYFNEFPPKLCVHFIPDNELRCAR
jgi:mRNA export factor